MPYSALALGLASPRLRSRRRHYDRSHRLSIRLAVATITAVGVVGFIGANLQARSSPIDSARLDQQRYLQAVWPIYTDLEVNATRMGLAAALFENEDIDRIELVSRLDAALVSFRRADDQLGALQPPAELDSVHEGYLQGLGLYERAALEMRKAGEDGDESHIATGVTLMLEGIARVHALANRFWPARVGLGPRPRTVGVIA